MSLIKNETIWIPVSALIIYLLATQEVIYKRFIVEGTKYEAVLSYDFYKSLIPMPIGSSSDKSGYVEIFDGKKRLGKMPMPALQYV